MKRLLLAFLAALMPVGCGAQGVGNDSETKPNDENPAESAEVQIQAQTDEAETAQTDESEIVTDSASEELPDSEPESPLPVVYMTSDISSDGLMAVYAALDAAPEGKIAVKISTGEPGSNYLRTEPIGELVQSLDGTIVECNTAYGGQRANTAMHYQVAKDHGYSDIADVDIMDKDGSMTLAVEGGSMWSAEQDPFLESMAEAGKSVVDALGGNILYINVMNRLSVDCDCDSNPAEPDMHDIGILASFDPVALDQACIDLVYAAEDGQSLIKRIESRNGLHTLEHAEEIGLGSRTYTLENIDD